MLEYFIKLITKLKKSTFVDLKKGKDAKGSAYKPIKFPLFVQYKDDNISSTSNAPTIEINKNNVNTPFNDNFELTERKWYFITLKIGTNKNLQTSNTGSGSLSGQEIEIDYQITISNARENESVQLFFPGETKDFPNISIPLYLYSLEFDYIGKLT